jgi:hypothetical protein
LKGEDFWRAVEVHPEILNRGMYHRHLQRYFALFPAENLRVWLYDELQDDPQAFLLAVDDFLGVSPHLPENLFDLINVSGEPRLPWLSRAVGWSKLAARRHRLNFLFEWVEGIGLQDISNRILRRNVQPFEHKPALSEADRARLAAIYRQDIEQLEGLLGRDLQAWKR